MTSSGQARDEVGIVDPPHHEPDRRAARQIQVIALGLVAVQCHRQRRMEELRAAPVVAQQARHVAEAAVVADDVGVEKRQSSQALGWRCARCTATQIEEALAWPSVSERDGCGAYG